MLLAGVDGGGSKTRLILTDGAGEILADVEGGRSAMRPGQAERSADVIEALLREALSAAGRETARPQLLLSGLAGVGREEQRIELENELDGRRCADDIVVTSDAAIALFDAFQDAAGAILIAGTGSICYARSATGEFHRCGGWGSVFGDEGGGAWIGKRALGIIAAAHDGREPETALTGSVLTALQLNSVEELIPWALASDNDTLAGLAPVVFSTATSGDLRANSLVSLAVEELTLHVRSVAVRVFGDARATVPLALTGGLMKRGSLLRKRLEQRLKSAVPGAQIRPDEVIPARGAVRLAAQQVRRTHLPI